MLTVPFIYFSLIGFGKAENKEFKKNRVFSFFTWYTMISADSYL